MLAALVVRLVLHVVVCLSIMEEYFTSFRLCLRARHHLVEKRLSRVLNIRCSWLLGCWGYLQVLDHGSVPVGAVLLLELQVRRLGSLL